MYTYYMMITAHRKEKKSMKPHACIMFLCKHKYTQVAENAQALITIPGILSVPKLQMHMLKII